MKVVKVDMMTGAVVRTYESAREAEADSGLSRNAVRHACEKRRVGNTGFFWRWEGDFDPCEDWSRNRTRPWMAVNARSGEVLWDSFGWHLAERIGASESAVHAAWHSGGTVGGRWRIVRQDYPAHFSELRDGRIAKRPLC